MLRAHATLGDRLYTSSTAWQTMSGMKEKATGYFPNGLPFNRFGYGPRTLVVFQGLLFEDKPMTVLASPAMPGRYRFLEDDYTIWIVMRKPGLPAGYTLRDMADDYAAMIRDQFGEPVDVIGISTGGSIAQHFAADHPELLKRLILHSSAYRLSEPAKRMQTRVAELARAGRWREANSVSMRFMLRVIGGERPIAAALIEVGAMLAGSLGAPRDPSDLVVTIEAEDKHDFRARLGEIVAPTLVIAGDLDPFYTEQLFRDTAAGIPNARLILYKGMGHPASGVQFAKEVRAFLTEVARPMERAA